MNEQEKRLYEQGNPFLDYNHIKVVSASPDRADMAVELVPESRNLYGFMHCWNARRALPPGRMAAAM